MTEVEEKMDKKYPNRTKVIDDIPLKIRNKPIINDSGLVILSE